MPLWRALKDQNLDTFIKVILEHPVIPKPNDKINKNINKQDPESLESLRNDNNNYKRGR